MQTYKFVSKKAGMFNCKRAYTITARAVPLVSVLVGTYTSTFIHLSVPAFAGSSLSSIIRFRT